MTCVIDFFFIKGKKIYIISKNIQGWRTSKFIYKIYKKKKHLENQQQWLDEEPNQGQSAEPNT
jgi:hypothetical protein